MFQSRDDEGLVHVQARNDDIHEQQAIILAAIGDNFESANASVMYQARNVLNARATKDDHEAEIKAVEKDIKPEWRENWYDGLGYCTWNGIGQNLTEHKILEALDHLASVNVHITSLIIDDNWQFEKSIPVSSISQYGTPCLGTGPAYPQTANLPKTTKLCKF
ncbi:hypothetical protein HYQ46_006764 [Verticillium longisporum]|nr:hypothetical protein HYQ46_006764 [Verticillium longisporum]